ncbi:MAG: ABC-type transport auxiliary lipoprotein family protein [Pseudomonadota bacterium]
MQRLTLIAALLLAACGPSEGPSRYEVPVSALEREARSRFATVEVREITLPLYAELDEIPVEDAAGIVRSDTNVLWADDPVRAVTRRLTDALATVTGVTVAESPWPFEDPADARVELRFDRLIAAADGQVRAEGQAFIAPRALGAQGRSLRFRASAPYTVEDVGSVARAQAIVLDEIARQVAAGLR